MRLLLDTHVFLWVRGDPDRLKDNTRRILSDPESDLLLSVVSLWEIVVKCRLGKLRVDLGLILARMAPAGRVALQPLEPAHLITLNSLPFHPQHRDPFDHLIIAQAIAEGLTLVTADPHASLYPVQVMTP